MPWPVNSSVPRPITKPIIARRPFHCSAKDENPNFESFISQKAYSTNVTVYFACSLWRVKFDTSSSFRGDSSQICYGVLYFSFSHKGSNDFNAPIMSLFREIKRKLIIKQSEVSKRKSATELRSSRLPRINENILYISSVMLFFSKIHLIIPLLSFLIDTRKKLHKNTTEAIPSATILRLLRARLPTVKASINNIHMNYITRWQSSNGSLDTIECSIYCRKSLRHMNVFYFLAFSQAKASSKRWMSKFISQILLYMPAWYIHF